MNDSYEKHGETMILFVGFIIISILISIAVYFGSHGVTIHHKVEFPSAETIGEKTGKTTGDLGKGFMEGLIKSIKEKSDK